MKNFYIFLDIDGVLNDIEHIKKVHMSGIKENATKIFNPESVLALNNLINYLSQNFNVNLVISSTWRKNMESTLHYLNKNNIY